MHSQVTYEPATHHNKQVILIRFEYSRELNKRVKALAGVQWSRSQKAWYVPDTPHFRRKFGLTANLMGKEAEAKIHPVNQPAFNKLIEILQLKAYSPSTIKTYRNEFAQ